MSDTGERYTELHELEWLAGRLTASRKLRPLSVTQQGTGDERGARPGGRASSYYSTVWWGDVYGAPLTVPPAGASLRAP